jgi:hypothetical protein
MDNRPSLTAEVDWKKNIETLAETSFVPRMPLIRGAVSPMERVTK